MHFFPGNILAACFGQQNPHILPGLQHSLLLAFINGNHRTFSSVYLNKAFLF